MDLDFESAVTELRRAWFPEPPTVWVLPEPIRLVKYNMYGGREPDEIVPGLPE